MSRLQFVNNEIKFKKVKEPKVKKPRKTKKKVSETITQTYDERWTPDNANSNSMQSLIDWIHNIDERNAR